MGSLSNRETHMSMAVGKEGRGRWKGKLICFVLPHFWGKRSEIGTLKFALIFFFRFFAYSGQQS